MKKEYAEEVAAKIIEQLEQGTAPWQKPWKPGELSLPYNAATGKEYRGINSMWLAMQGHGDPRWMTYNQAGEAGAQVRKGAKGTKIVYWKTHDEEKAKDEGGKPIIGDDGKPKMIRVALERPRAFHAVVFNAEQIDGLPPLEPKIIAPEPERHARAEVILANSGANIQHVAGNRAFYRPSTDSITLPERGQFESADGYYATALHELGHWTGHPSRLDRDLAHPFGSEGYAREELRAEISSLMVGERLELGHDPGQHAAYVGSWVKSLKEDPREIFRAAADAEKIAAYVMAFEQEQVREQTQEQDAGHPVMPAAAENAIANARRAILAGFDASESWSEKETAARARAEARSALSALDDGDVMYAANRVHAAALMEQRGGSNGADDFLKASELTAELAGLTAGAADQSMSEERNTQAELSSAQQTVLDLLRQSTLTPSEYELAVPYAEKEQAKNVAKESGFKLQWDKENKAWFAPAGADLSRMDQWKPDAPRVQTPTAKSAEEQFSDALKEAGLVVDGLPIMDGKIHRVPVEGDRGGETSGAYAGHMEGRIPGGYVQNFKTGEIVNWKAEGTVAQTTPEERARLAAEAAERQQKREAETGQKQEATAAAANALWEHCPPATAENAYCKAKGITDPVGLRTVPEAIPEDVAKAHNIHIAKTVREAKALREADPEARVFKTGDLLIPARDNEQKLWTLQSVNPTFKSFMKGGRKHGLFAQAGIGKPDTLEKLGDPKVPVIVAEGYATADAVSKLAGQPVIVAFDSGNLDAIVRDRREWQPERTILIAADNDHEAPSKLGTDGKPRQNVGMEKATAAAQEHGAGVVAPQFRTGEKGSDWNDYLATRGEEEARREFASQMALAKRDAAINAERLTTLARERDQEARNDPTTSLDDAAVAAERGKAASMITSAGEQVSHINNAADQGLANNSGGTPALSSVKASLDRKTGELKDDTKHERAEVLGDKDSKEVPWKKLPKEIRDIKTAAALEGRAVTLPADAPAKLRKAAGLEVVKRRQSAGAEL